MAMNMDAMLRIKADVQGENNIRRLGNAMQGVEGRAKNLSMSLAALGGPIARLAALAGGGLLLGKIFGDTATLQSQAKSLEVLTGNAAQAAQIIAELQTFANVTPFESRDLIETAKRLNAFGVEATRVVEVTKRLGDVAGATGANLGELATAYGQVVAKGRLQGEELLQFQERGVALSAELQKMYGLQGQEFTKALESGRISAEAVEVAIERLTIAGGKYANGAIAQSDTLRGKLSTLQDAFTNLAINIGKVLEPIFKFLLDQTTRIINRLNDATYIQDEIRARQEANLLARNRFGLRSVNPFDAEVQRFRAEQERRLFDSFRAGRGTASSSSQRTTARSTPPLLSSKADSAETAARKAAAEAKRAAAEAARLEERRNQLTKQAISLQEQLRYSLEDVRAETVGVGANAADRLFIERSDALTENQRRVKALTLDVVELKREIEAAGGSLDVGLFADLINQNSAATEALIDKRYLQGLKDLLPSLEEYDGKIAEVQQGKTELTEVEKLNAQINLLQLDILAQTNPALREHIDLLRKRAQALDEATAKQKADNEAIGTRIRDRLQDYYNSVKDLGSAIGDAVVGGLQGLEDALTEFVVTGKASFKDLARSILADLARIALRAAIIQPIVQALGGIFPGFKFAMGGIMTDDGPLPLKKYATGGIARSPQLAMFGEGSQPEAFVPLPDGRRIPVAMKGGGGGTVVNVNVDATGTSVQGNAGQGERLGRVIAQAVQAELIRQKRPGGLLMAA